MDRCLSLVFGYDRTDESASPGSSTTHSANRELRRSRARASFNIRSAPPGTTARSSVPTSPGATNSPDPSGGCYMNVL